MSKECRSVIRDEEVDEMYTRLEKMKEGSG